MYTLLLDVLPNIAKNTTEQNTKGAMGGIRPAVNEEPHDTTQCHEAAEPPIYTAGGVIKLQNDQKEGSVMKLQNDQQQAAP